MYTYFNLHRRLEKNTKIIDEMFQKVKNVMTRYSRKGRITENG